MNTSISIKEICYFCLTDQLFIHQPSDVQCICYYLFNYNQISYNIFTVQCRVNTHFYSQYISNIYYLNDEFSI